MTLAELNLDPETKEKLRELLVNADIFRSTGVFNSNGADSYRCPCCFGSTKIQGNAYSYGTLEECEHEPDCNLLKLYKDLYE